MRRDFMRYATGEGTNEFVQATPPRRLPSKMTTPMKRRTIIDTYTCSRCSAQLQVDISGTLNTRMELGDAESASKFKTEGWSRWRSLDNNNFEATLCPECTSDAHVFLTSPDGFVSTEQCRFFDEYCTKHKFHHGAEATELREGIQAILDSHNTNPIDVTDFDVCLTRLLETVDARDSLAYAEHVKKEKEEEPRDPTRLRNWV